MNDLATPTRRLLLAGPAALMSLSACAQAAPPPRELVVYKTPWCGCCKGWVTHMTRAGFTAQVRELEDLAPIRTQHSIPFPLSSCHTALIGGYVIEGHVPPEDVVRLLKEKPKALGLTVPGMPLGSPGMESPSGAREIYDTLLLLEGGRTQVFSKHGAA